MKTLTKFRVTYAAFCLVLFCAVAIPAHAATSTVSTPTPTPTPSFPLKKSSNNRYLVGQDETPFLLIGDSPWYLSTQGTYADIDTFLANRAAKGFNAIIVALIDSHASDHAPNDIDGVAPFTTPGNFSTYNAAYFNRFDYILDQAANYGMVVVAFPLYVGYNCGQEGFAQQIAADTTAHIQSYATFLGNRYKNKGNIIWVMAGDCSPFTCSINTKIDAFATALLAADPNHLITEHNQRFTEAVTPWIAGGIPSWLRLNNTYADDQTYSLSQTAYNRTPARPIFTVEGWYENMHSQTNKTLRSQAYWSILSGNCGYMFGNCPLFGLSSTITLATCRGANPDWHVQMDNTASNDMTRVKNFFTSFAWEKLVPDFNHTVVTAGYGTGNTTVTTACAFDRSFAVSYLPAVSGVTVNMTSFAGSSVTGRWYDPTNGTYTTVSGSPFPNTETHVFTPTGNNNAGASDWVLLLQSSISPPTLSTNQSSYSPGESIVATFSNASGNSRDWIGLFAAGAPNTSYLQWFYTDGTHTGTPGITNGSVTFPSGLPNVGNYEARLFFSGTYTMQASTAFTVQVGPPGRATNPNPANNATSVGLNPTLTWTAGAGATSHKIYFGTNPNLGDGDLKATQTGTSYAPGPLSIQTSYYWRIDEVNGQGITTGVVWMFTTGSPPAISTNKSSYGPGESIVTTFSNASGNFHDWIGLFVAGSPNTSYLQWFYTDGTQAGSPGIINGSVTFPTGLPNPGNYEARLFFSGSYTMQASAAFTVQNSPQATDPNPASSSTGVNLNPTLTWSAGSGATAHRVYFGTNANPGAAEFKGEQAGTSYNPGSLLTQTTYYWRIDEVNGQVITTGVVWPFTTAVSATAPTIAVTKGLYARGEAIVTNFGNASGNARDWVGLFVAGAPNTSYLLWYYTDGTQTGSPGIINGSVTFPNGLLNAGNYEARLFFNDNYTLKASTAFRVQ